MLEHFLKSKIIKCMCLSISVSMTGCSLFYDKEVEYETVFPQVFPVIKAIGYAPISSQPGATDEERVLMAMRASKLDAYRELAEQVYGQNLNGTQTLGSLVLNNSELTASVNGVIQGAEVVKAYSVGEDTYVTEMLLDMGVVQDLYISIAKPQRVKNVVYY
ncbi:LPP20 family lipoprotein [Alteromonas sp. 5E99-2]|uniref:LPP20 family lipoprotein n=1 Tax=Alteromonas sp. 5E99-2 TaxID=2817683 RepID=UPI001A98FA8E|nr:LPP20 family lipoprotein [Alteromonas sp. 5E99-2]MBO1254080.1 LPP20 family lipoprotein [Alteromonas sp. 5E99-2]